MPSNKLLAGMGIAWDPPDGFAISAPIPDLPAWHFEAAYSRRGGQWRLEQVCVYPADHEQRDGQRIIRSVPPAGVTQGVLRKVPLGHLPEYLNSVRTVDGQPLFPKITGETLRDFRKRPRPGRFGRDDRPYAELASKYLELCASSKQPIVELASRERFAPTTVRDALAEARRRGLLISAGRGRAGGELSPEAIRILEEQR